MNNVVVKLGWKAKDRITGFTGVVDAYTVWLNGCVRVSLQPKTCKDGKYINDLWLDANQVEYIGSKPVMEANEVVVLDAKPIQVAPSNSLNEPPGGPQNDPRSCVRDPQL